MFGIKNREEEKGATSLLDYFGIVGDGIVLLWPGIFMAGWEISGPDMDSLEDAESWQVAHRLANKLKLGRGWTIQCDLIRGEYHEYCPESPNWPDPISYMIDRERRFRYHLAGDPASPRLSRYFLTLSYEPKLKASRRAARFVFLNDSQEGAGPNEQALQLFKKRIGEINAQLKANMTSTRRLRTYRRAVGEKDQVCDEMMQHVRRCITGEDYPFAVPRDPSQLHELLNQYLATDDMTGGAEPQTGDPLNYLLPGKRIAVISIDAFPEDSWAGIMRELDGIPYDFRYTQAGQILDELEAKESHDINKGRWKGKKRPDRRKLLPVGEDDPLAIDREAEKLEIDAADASAKAEYGKETSVRFSAKVIVTESDAALLKRTVDAVVSTVKHSCGFGCRIETIDAVAAWLSSFPGQHYKEPRLFLVNVNNMVDMMPLSAPYRGLLFNPSKYYPPKSPPLMYAVTSGGTPFRLHQNVSDVGHELLVGPTGAGKSVYLGAKAAQFFRFPNAQVYVFDKKKSMYTLCKAMGGIFHDISPDNGPQLCPLADLETPGERDWAAQVLRLLLEENGLSVTHEEGSQIKQTLELLNEEPCSGRSLSDFVMAIPAQRIKNGLAVYLDGILDADRDSMAMSRFCVFEMDELYRLDKKVMNGALFCIFGKIRRRLDSSIPTLMMVDEFREALEHPMAAEAFDGFLYEGRKLNLAVILTLQDFAKALASPLKQAILQQCHTKTCLPNPQALLEAADHYQMLGCNARDRELIAYAEPKNHYYVMSADGKRMISFEFGDLALAFLANSSDADRREVDRLIEREGEGWQSAWLRQKGLHDWSDLHEELKSKLIADYRYAAKEAAAYA